MGLRDLAVLGCLAFAAARTGAVARLTRGSLQPDGTYYQLRFLEKGGKRRDIPVRADLEGYLLAYLDAAGLTDAPVGTSLFRTVDGKSGRPSANWLGGVDVCRLVRGRLLAAGQPAHLFPHSVQVAGATDLLQKSVSLEDMQILLGHSDPRTTRL